MMRFSTRSGSAARIVRSAAGFLLSLGFAVHANAQEAATAGTCDDLIDNDSDGYVDAYDSECHPAPHACTRTSSVEPFSIGLGNATAAELEDLFWPIAADVDADGAVEVIVANEMLGHIQVLDGATLALESFIAVNGNRGDNFSVANLDDDPDLELVTMVHGVRRMIVADLNGEDWVIHQSAADEMAFDCGGNVGTGLGLSFADFDQDGTPEIVYGNEIWSVPDDLGAGCADCIVKTFDADRDLPVTAAHGCASGAPGGGAQGAIAAVADVLRASDCGGDAECDGPELIVAFQVYSVDLDAGTATLRRDANVFGSPATFGDGFTAIADLDSDGDLDVVVHGTHSGGLLYAYDPRAGAITQSWTFAGAGGHGYSPLTIADVTLPTTATRPTRARSACRRSSFRA